MAIDRKVKYNHKRHQLVNNQPLWGDLHPCRRIQGGREAHRDGVARVIDIKLQWSDKMWVEDWSAHNKRNGRKSNVAAEDRLLFNLDRARMRVPQAELESRRYSVTSPAAGPHRLRAGSDRRGRRWRLGRRREFLLKRSSFNAIQWHLACHGTR